MMPRKKRITIIIISIVIIIFAIVGILTFLYLKTDAFKSNEKLFMKYFMQNFSAIQSFKNENATTIQTKLDNNKYTSEITGKIEYIQDKSTSNENKDSNINNVQLNINAQTDKLNNYYYKNIQLANNNEKLMRAEYLNENNTYGLRLDGIKQFVSIENNNLDELSKKIGIDNLESMFQKIDLKTTLEFTEEEKTNIKSTYLGIIQANISKDKYYKQRGTMITVSDKDVKTNSYYIKMTIEEYNNLCVKMLKQLSQDEIVLSKIDMIEEKIRTKCDIKEDKGYIRKEFVDNINNQIEKIENKNIGQDEVKITVYESNMQIIRTTIETATNKTVVDIYDNNSIKIDNTVLGETQNEQIFQIEKSESNMEDNYKILYEEINGDKIERNIKINFNQKNKDDKISNQFQIKLSNEKYDATFNIEDNIIIVNEFKNNNSLNENNIKLNGYDKEKIEIITNLLLENVKGQLQKLNSVVTINDYIEMLKNLNMIKSNSIQISDESTISETEKNRFNSQFEFFVSSDLSTDNVVELLSIAKENFYDIEVILQDGTTDKLDIQKILSKSYNESREYINSIKEIDILVKKNITNDEKEKNLSDFLDNVKDLQYNVSLDYNEENGLVNRIKMEVAK